LQIVKKDSLFNNYKNIFFVVVGLLIFLISKDYGVFWDNVLFASKMGNELYGNSIFSWTIPESFNPDYPFFLGFLLAIFWRVLGHELWVSHLLMLPFVVGFFSQLYEFILYFVKKQRFALFALLLVIADPTVATTLILVNPEIIIFFFFFLAINGVLKQRNRLKFIGLFFLSIITFRSMMLFAGIFIFDIANNLFIHRQKLKSFFNLKFLLFYFFASLPAFVFITWKLATKGWFQSHPDSPWTGLWQIASPGIYLKNCVVLIWRYLDFGRIFIFLFLLISILRFGKKIVKSTKNKQLLAISICAVIFTISISLFATNTLGHRYFTVSYIGFIIFSFSLITESYKSKKIIYFFLFLGLLSGNLWIYPKKISQGWDATLAHVPYHSLRLEAIDYLNKEAIKIEEVASFFPNYTTLDLINFDGNQHSFSKFNCKKKYAFYATFYNLSDKELNKLNKNYAI
jgi:hypothetical protein